MRETSRPDRPERESVWDYPRRPRLEPADRPVRVVFGGDVVAETSRALKVRERGSPPTYYIPLEDVAPGVLVANHHRTYCEWKGRAAYFDLVAGDRRSRRAAWTYPQPKAGYSELMYHVAFYAGRVDAAYLGDEQVVPQPGTFYGGWITAEVAGL